MNETLYRIIAIMIMCIVTYIPRAVPITFFNKRIESQFIKDILYYVPYAVLSSLTFPAIFYSTNNVLIAAIGTLAAIIFSLIKDNLVLSALISVVVCFTLSFFL